MSAALGLSDEDVTSELDRLVEAELVYRQGRPPNVSVHLQARADSGRGLRVDDQEGARACARATPPSSSPTKFPDAIAREPETQAHHLTEAGLIGRSD